MATKVEAQERSELELRIRHLEGCPEERSETHTERQPNGREITIARCIDCGASTAE